MEFAYLPDAVLTLYLYGSPFSLLLPLSTSPILASLARFCVQSPDICGLCDADLTSLPLEAAAGGSGLGVLAREPLPASDALDYGRLR